MSYIVLVRYLRHGVDHVEEPAEELVDNEGEQADADDQSDRENRGGDPLLAGRPRDAPKLRDDAADEVAACDRLGRSLLLFVHQRFTSEELAGRTGLEPATTGFGDQDSTN